METAHVLALYESYAGDRLTFLYSGNFHDEHTARLIALQEEFLEREDAPRPMRSKLAFVMVEAYQNIVRHRTATYQGANGRSVFILRSTGTIHEVTAMNVVGKKDEGKLVEALAHLAGMDAQEMKQNFLHGLRSDSRSERGGAGLGLLEMARRSGNPLRHAFSRMDQEHALFALQVLVGERKWRSSDAGPVATHHDLLVAHGIALLFRGALPAVDQENLMRVIERDLYQDPPRAARAKHAFLLAMGAMADLGVSGEGPMVLVSMRGARTTVTVATPVDVEGADRLQRVVEVLNAMDAPVLQRRYRDILLGRGDPASGLDLGLMDLMRRSAGGLRCGRSVWRGQPFTVLEVDV